MCPHYINPETKSAGIRLQHSNLNSNHFFLGPQWIFPTNHTGICHLVSEITCYKHKTPLGDVIRGKYGLCWILRRAFCRQLWWYREMTFPQIRWKQLGLFSWLTNSLLPRQHHTHWHHLPLAQRLHRHWSTPTKPSQREVDAESVCCVGSETPPHDSSLRQVLSGNYFITEVHIVNILYGAQYH